MKIGIAALIGAYVLSQFYRAFLAVLAPVIGPEIGALPGRLAEASGWWFLAFAAMQLPVGWALDRIGPRVTVSVALALGAVGAGFFAMAQNAVQIDIAMALIGVGCSPVLMASYFIFAREYSPSVFATLAGATIGIGSLGNLAASLPLSLTAEAVGWRSTVWGLAGLTLAMAGLLALLVRNPLRAVDAGRGSVLDLLRLPALWPVFLMMAAAYAPAAGLRGLWVGPWRAEVFGESTATIGWVTLVMGLCMVAGNFAYGPADRIFGSRKRVVLAGNALTLSALLLLALGVDRAGLWPLVLLAVIGAFGASFPVVMAHGRAFLPAHLTGRGVSLINLFGIGMAGLMQRVTGRHFDTLTLAGTAPARAFQEVFLIYAGLTAAGLLVYLFARDRMD